MYLLSLGMESIYYLGMGFVFGAALGSFTKVLADRSLKRQGINGRSYCPGCKTTLRWYDLLPVISFILIKGRCRYCRRKIGLEYIVIEIISGIIFSLLFSQLPYSVFFSQDYFRTFITLTDLLFKSFSICILLSVALTDIRKMLIPDRIILPSIVIACIYLISITLIKTVYFGYMLIILESLFYPASAAILIAGFFYSLIVVTKGRGMGGGDVKLGAFMGLVLGFEMSMVALMIAFLSGSVVGILLIISGKKSFGEHIAFGPFLVLGSITALLWGKEILQWYLSLSI